MALTPNQRAALELLAKRPATETEIGRLVQPADQPDVRAERSGRAIGAKLRKLWLARSNADLGLWSYRPQFYITEAGRAALRED